MNIQQIQQIECQIKTGRINDCTRLYNTWSWSFFRPEEEEEEEKEQEDEDAEEEEEEEEGIPFKIEHKMVGTVVKARRLYNTWYLI